MSSFYWNSFKKNYKYDYQKKSENKILKPWGGCPVSTIPQTVFNLKIALSLDIGPFFNFLNLFKNLNSFKQKNI